ncbi:MAG: O-antigen ligase family protein [Patescibacteria group bacterium]
MISKNPFVGLLALIISIPFERFPSINIGNIDIRANQLIASLTIVSLILYKVFKKKKFSSYAVAPLILLFSASMIISMSQAENLTRAITVLVFTFFMILISFAVTNLINTKLKLQAVTKYLLATSFLVGIFGFFQFFGDVIGLPTTITILKDIYTKEVFGFPRIQAFSMEPLFYADFLFIPLCITLILFLKNDKLIFSKKFLLVIFSIIFLNMILTLSRGAYLGLCVVAFVVIILQFKNVFSIKNLKYILVVFSITFIGAYLFLARTGSNSVSVFMKQATLGDLGKSESTVARLTTFDQSLEAWQNHKIFGIGPGNFGPYVKNYPSDPGVSGWPTVNNEYLEILCEMGVVGLSVFILVIFTIYCRSFIAYRVTRDIFLKSMILGTTLALTGILIQYFTFSTLYIIHVWFLIGLILAIQNIAFKGDCKDE